MPRLNERLQVAVSGDVAPLRDDMREAERQIERFASRSREDIQRLSRQTQSLGRDFRGIIGAAAGLASGIGLGVLVRELGQASNAAIVLADSLGRTSAVLDLPVDETHAYRVALERLGRDGEGVVDLFADLEDRVQELADGTSSFRDDFALLNLTFGDLANLDPTQRLALIEERIRGSADQTRALAAASRLLPEFAGVLGTISVEADRARDRLADIGAALGPEHVATAARLRGEIAGIGAAAEGAFAVSLLENLEAGEASLEGWDRLMASIAENAGSAAADFLTFASRTADDLAVLFGQADAATRLRDARADLLRIEERLAFIRRQPAFERGTQFRDATREAERLRDLISSLENREGADAAIELALNFTTGATGDQAVQEATEASRLVTEATDRQAAAARSLVDRYDRSGAATRRFADDLGQLDDLLGLPAFHLAAIGQSVEDLTTAREGLLRQRFELDTDFDRGPLDAAVRAARESFEEEARIRREGEADARAYLDALDLTGAAQRRYNDGLLETQRLLAGGFITQEQADSGLRSLQERLGDDLEALGDVDTDGFTQRLRGTLRDSLIAVGQFDDLGDFSDNIFRAVAIELNREAVDNLLDLDFAGIFARLREALEGGLGGLLDGFGGLAGTVLPFGGGRAYGGPVAAGTLYAVGERGPEWFIPNQDGRIVPEAGPGISVTVPLQVQGDVGRATRREALLLQEQAAASAFELAREHAV